MCIRDSIDITHPSDALHLSSTRTVEIPILAPSITIRRSGKTAGASVISIAAGPSYAKKIVDIWTTATATGKAKLAGHVKLDASGHASFTKALAKISRVIVKYKGTKIASVKTM